MSNRRLDLPPPVFLTLDGVRRVEVASVPLSPQLRRFGCPVGLFARLLFTAEEAAHTPERLEAAANAAEYWSMFGPVNFLGLTSGDGALQWIGGPPYLFATRYALDLPTEPANDGPPLPPCAIA